MTRIRDLSGNGANNTKVTTTGNFLIDIARGCYPGLSPFNLIGSNVDIDNAREDIWEVGANYVFPTSPMQMEVISSSADDAAAGTGVRTVDIHYLDTDYNEQIETVTLNGLTAVATVATNILRVNDFHTVTAGSGKLAAGNISLQNTANTVTYSYIPLGNNRARQFVYTVPAGHTLYIVEGRAGAGGSSPHYCELMIRATQTDGGEEVLPGIFNHQFGFFIQDGATSTVFPVPRVFQATVDIKATGISDAASSNVDAICGMSGWLEKDID